MSTLTTGTNETPEPMPERKRRLIDAAVRLILRQGYSGTTVDQVCAEAGVTKGAFFHYFPNKEEIGRAAMDAWTEGWHSLLASSGLDQVADPLDRLEGLFDVMIGAYLIPEIGPGCVVGTIAQEVGLSNRGMGDTCESHFDLWAGEIRTLLGDAKAAHPPIIDFDPASVADLMLGIVQGTLLVAKTRQDRAVIVNNVRHCRAYVLGLFGRTAS